MPPGVCEVRTFVRAARSARRVVSRGVTVCVVSHGATLWGSCRGVVLVACCVALCGVSGYVSPIGARVALCRMYVCCVCCVAFGSVVGCVCRGVECRPLCRLLCRCGVRIACRVACCAPVIRVSETFLNFFYVL